MGVAEILFALVLGLSTGYQAGKAGQRVEAVESGEICFDEAYGNRKQGCYKVVDADREETTNPRCERHPSDPSCRQARNSLPND